MVFNFGAELSPGSLLLCWFGCDEGSLFNLRQNFRNTHVARSMLSFFSRRSQKSLAHEGSIPDFSVEVAITRDLLFVF